MSLLTRYLIKRLGSMTLLSLLALLSLYVFFDVVSESADLGKNGYNVGSMAAYIVLLIPAHVYELMPLAVLIGALITLSGLANNSELTVMKASGVSTKRFIQTLLGFGLVFAIATAGLGEWAAPKSQQYAKRLKDRAQNNDAPVGQSGVWVKNEGRYINFGELLPDLSVHNLQIFTHNANYQITQTLQAASAINLGNNQWQLNDVALTDIATESTKVSQAASMNVTLEIDEKILRALQVEPDQMSLLALGDYIAHLKANSQQTERYQIAWWRKLTYPLAVLAMALIALAFTPQSTRRTNTTIRLFVGIFIGIAFHFANRFFAFSAQLYNVNPAVAAVLPTLLFFVIAIVWIRKQEKR